MFSRVAEDVIGRWLDHDTFVLTLRSCSITIVLKKEYRVLVRGLWGGIVGWELKRVCRDWYAKYSGVFCVKMAHGFRERFSTLGFSYTTNVSYNVSFSRMKIFFLFFQGRRSPRGSTQNPCEVSYWIISCSEVSEGSERQKSETCRELHFWLYENYLPQLFVRLFMFIYESCFIWLSLTVRRTLRESIFRGTSRRSK